jgi:ABC-type polysaccharide/polyol phosphate transport system ATPase subunit
MTSAETLNSDPVKRNNASENTLGGIVPLPHNPANGIEVHELSKRYRVISEQVGRLSGFLVHRLASKMRRKDLWALRDVSFDVKRGEILGIIGPNGAGKSTLLRTITGITTADSGEIRRMPRVAALLDLSAGFHPSLTGYENLFLTGSILGFSRSELRQRLPEIIRYSGVNIEYLDSPVRYYSSGMLTRLGFSLAVHTEPDVVLIDEVLAVGDAEFQAKSAQKLLEFRDQGKTMILVSHMVTAIHQFCTRAVWLQNGHARLVGPAAEVVTEYRSYINRRIHEHSPEQTEDANGTGASAASSTGKLASRIHSINLLDQKGTPSRTFETGGRMIVQAQMEISSEIPEIDVILSIHHSTGALVSEISAIESGSAAVKPSRRSAIAFTLDPLLLKRGAFRLSLRAVNSENAEDVLFRSDQVPFEVEMQQADLVPCYPATLPCTFDIN